MAGEAEEDWKAQFEELEAEFEDFQTTSREVERALEQDLEQARKELREAKERLADERRSAADSAKKTGAEADRLQQALDAANATIADQGTRLQRLESENDTLQAKERALGATVSDLSQVQEKTLEDNALLATQAEQAEAQRMEEVQRLKDDLRSMREELDKRNATEQTITTGEVGGSLPSAVANGVQSEQVLDEETDTVLRDLSSTLKEIAATARRITEATQGQTSEQAEG